MLFSVYSDITLSTVPGLTTIPRPATQESASDNATFLARRSATILVLRISRWKWIMPWGNGVLTPDLAVSPMSREFTTAFASQHLSCSIFGLTLSVMDTARAIRVIPFVRPLSVPAWINASTWIAHFRIAFFEASIDETVGSVFYLHQTQLRALDAVNFNMTNSSMQSNTF